MFLKWLEDVNTPVAVKRALHEVVEPCLGQFPVTAATDPFRLVSAVFPEPMAVIPCIRKPYPQLLPLPRSPDHNWILLLVPNFSVAFRV